MATAKRYPWDRWLRPGEFTAVKGEDFHGRTASFVNMIRQRAIGREVSVHVEVSDDEQLVKVEVRRKPAFVEATEQDIFEDRR